MELLHDRCHALPLDDAFKQNKQPGALSHLLGIGILTVQNGIAKILQCSSGNPAALS